MDVFTELRRESQSVFNRLHSIAEDAAFVGQVHDHYHDLPLLPNMRCGAWYTNPKITSEERAYFKSTDGHTNNWSFNLRRPNLHILSLITRHAGLVLVDSTRAGKRVPDALSKTVPIWCTVVNRAIRGRVTQPQDWDTKLYTPPGSVSSQEHRQIELKLDGWVSQLVASSYRLPKLDHPLRPIWITPATTVFPCFPEATDRTFYPIICVSASKQVTDGLERRSSGFTYVQGSGDDHELWSMGLTPDLYWKHHDEILSMRPWALPDFIRALVSDASQHGDGAACLGPPLGTPIEHIYGRISICNTATLRQSDALRDPDVAFLCLTPNDLSAVGTIWSIPETSKIRMQNTQTSGGKKGQRYFLNAVLPQSMTFINHHLQDQRRICIACSTGTDISVGVAVAALALFFRPDGSWCSQGNRRDDISKDILKIRLQWIISSYPQANPSRTTLKRVNDFLLSPLPNFTILDIPDHRDNTPRLEE